MIERERFEAWARQRWTHPEDFDQRIKAPSKYNNYEVQAAWEAWQERATQPAPSVPDGWKEAAIAWEVCASIHREYGKGKDPFFNTRQGDFVKHANDARVMSALATEAKP